MLSFLLVGLGFSLLVILFMNQAKFGKSPKGERLKKIKNSSNFSNGKFQNKNFTPDLTEGATIPKVLKEFIFNRSKRISPKQPIPSIRTDLLNLAKDKNVLVWFGHSSYFLQVDGKTFLIDPVFSGSASPISATTKSFNGADAYKAKDIPAIDCLFLSHDHWDHLDYKTILELKPKIKKVLCSLGTAAHLEHWGIDKEIINEKDWDEKHDLLSGFEVFTTTARHFSGRGFMRNRALWMSFILKTPHFKIFIGGDSGYDIHFKDIGEKFGPFDLAILECGQYNKNWKYIHMMPEETVQAAIDLKANRLLPVHFAKFALAQHDWDEPILRVTQSAKNRNLPLVHPLIGEPVELNWKGQKFEEWWLSVN